MQANLTRMYPLQTPLIDACQFIIFLIYIIPSFELQTVCESGEFRLIFQLEDIVIILEWSRNTLDKLHPSRHCNGSFKINHF